MQKFISNATYLQCETLYINNIQIVHYQAIAIYDIRVSEVGFQSNYGSHAWKDKFSIYLE